MRGFVSVLASAILVAFAAAVGAQSCSAPSYMDPNYRPEFSPKRDDVVGHYTSSGNPKIDVWLNSDGSARSLFVYAPNDKTKFGSKHEFKGIWALRNGWIDISDDHSTVTFEFEPGGPGQYSYPKLSPTHALRSAWLLRYGVLAKVAGP